MCGQVARETGTEWVGPSVCQGVQAEGLQGLTPPSAGTKIKRHM